MTGPILDTVQWLLQFDKIKGHSAMCFDDNFIWLSKSLQQEEGSFGENRVFCVCSGLRENDPQAEAFRGPQELVSVRLN